MARNSPVIAAMRMGRHRRDASVRTREEDEIPYTYLPPMKTADGEYDLKAFFSHERVA